jgi:hypothetical protein
MARRHRHSYRHNHSHSHSQSQSQSHRKFPLILVGMLITGCVSALVVHLSAAGASTTVTATAVADASIDSAHPTTNNGTGPWVSVDSKPSKYAYFKFNVTVPSGATVTHADFRCWSGSSNAFGAQLWTTPTDWDESTITWANAPIPDFSNAPVGQTGPVSKSSYATVDVTSAIKGTGTYTFVGKTSSAIQWSCASHENSHKQAAQLVVTTTATSTPSPSPSSTSTLSAPGGAHASLALPARGAFSYPWFPEAWSQSGFSPATHYSPSLGLYSSMDVMARHVSELLYGGFQFDVSSWWGQGSKEDTRLAPLLTAAHGTGLKVAPYYEAEGNAVAGVSGSPNPTPAQLTSDLNYLASHYIGDPNYLWIAGKPALFVYGDGTDNCTTVDRWLTANAAATTKFYLVLKVFSGYGSCTGQPDNWHQYGPAVAESSQGGNSFSISPGFFKFSETAPRLARDLARWSTNVTDLNCSKASLKLVTTFNEWGEGTSVESASQWATASGHGSYLDELHKNVSCNNPSATTTTAAPSTSASSSSPTPTSSTTTSPSPSQSSSSPSGNNHKVLVFLFENHSNSEALSQMPHLASWASTFGQATNYYAITHPSLPNYLAIWGGSTFGVTSDCSVGQSGCIPAAPSVFGQTLAAGKTAKAYQESMTSNCQTGGSGSYAPRHGPWPYWLDTTERLACNANDVPSGTTSSGNLINDINSGSLPVTGEVTPNLCNDAHDCSLSTADNWLAGWIPKVMAGPDYTSGKLTILITFDEDDSSQGNKIAFVAIDPRLAGKTVSANFNHYALTKWLDDNAGVGELRNAATAGDLRAAFGL